MALTNARVLATNIGDRWMHVYTIAFDSSYPTGGEPLAQTDLGFASTVDDEFHVIIGPKAGYVFEFDYTNLKVIAYHSDNDAVADSALIQVPDTTNLSTLTGVRVTAFGRFLL